MKRSTWLLALNLLLGTTSPLHAGIMSWLGLEGAPPRKTLFDSYLPGNAQPTLKNPLLKKGGEGTKRVRPVAVKNRTVNVVLPNFPDTLAGEEPLPTNPVVSTPSFEAGVGEPYSQWRQDYHDILALARQKLGNFPLRGVEGRLGRHFFMIYEVFFTDLVKSGQAVGQFLEKLSEQSTILLKEASLNGREVSLAEIADKLALCQKRIEGIALLLKGHSGRIREVKLGVERFASSLATIPDTRLTTLDRLLGILRGGLVRLNEGIHTVQGLHNGLGQQLLQAGQNAQRTQELIRTATARSNQPFARSIPFHQAPLRGEIIDRLRGIESLVRQGQVKLNFIQELAQNTFQEAAGGQKLEKTEFEREVTRLLATSSELDLIVVALEKCDRSIEGEVRPLAKKLENSRQGDKARLKQIGGRPTALVRQNPISIPTWLIVDGAKRGNHHQNSKSDEPQNFETRIEGAELDGLFPLENHEVTLKGRRGTPTHSLEAERQAVGSLEEREQKLLKSLEEIPNWVKEEKRRLQKEGMTAKAALGEKSLPLTMETGESEDKTRNPLGFELPTDNDLEIKLDERQALLRPTDDFLGLLTNELPLD